MSPSRNPTHFVFIHRFDHKIYALGVGDFERGPSVDRLLESDGSRPQHLLLLPVGEDDLGDGLLVIGEEENEDSVPIDGEDETLDILELLAWDVALLVINQGVLLDERHQLIRWLLRIGRSHCHEQDEYRQYRSELPHGVSPDKFGMSSTSQGCSACVSRGLRYSVRNA